MLCKNLLSLAALAASVHAFVPGMADYQRQAVAERFFKREDFSDGGNQLDGNVVQQGSASDGAPSDGQATSDTSSNNFINFCAGKTLTNGLQQDGGSCNSIPMGDMPSSDNMVSCIINNPKPGDNLEADTDFTVDLTVQNLVAGVFTNPDTTYYSAPQKLQNGVVVGHSHVTIQDLGGTLTPTNPPDAKVFAFFKGIDDAGDGAGHLSVTVTGGLPAGFYRVCTINSAANHQPVAMPVAKRGAQEDCTKFTVGADGGAAGGAAGGGAAGGGADGGAGDNGGGNAGGNFGGGFGGGIFNGTQRVRRYSSLKKSQDKNQRFQARAWIT